MILTWIWDGKAMAKKRFFPRRDFRKAQVSIEFTFSVIMALIMLYSVVMILRWAGLDLAERRLSHDQLLIKQNVGPLQQIDPYFHDPIELNATFK